MYSNVVPADYKSLITFLALFQMSVLDATLQIQQVIVPTQVMTGSNVVLRCIYKDIPDEVTSTISTTMMPTPSSVATSPLYSLKWYSMHF